MIDDFVPIIHKLDGRTVRLWAVADVHIGAREADMDGFAEFLRRIEADPDSYIVLCGDIINNGIKDSLTNVYDEVMPPSAQIEAAVELLEPVKGRILGAVGGNHELRSKRAVDIDPMATIMTILRIAPLYRPNFAMMRVILEKNGVRDSYALMLIHGKSANKKKQLAYSVEGVDAIISGHTHDGIIEKPARLCFNNRNVVSVKHIVSMTATSWLDYGGYAARGLYLPKATSDPQALVLEYTGTNAKRGHMRAMW